MNDKNFCEIGKEPCDQTYYDELCEKLLLDIEIIERRTGTRLVAERIELENTPQKELIGKISRLDMYYFFSAWRYDLTGKYGLVP